MSYSIIFLMSIVFCISIASCKHLNHSELKIVNGKRVDCNEEELCKSTVAILIPGDSKKEIVCTGSVLASNLVLTAAHCFPHLKIDNVYIGIGEDPFENKLYQVRSFAYPHEFWSPKPGLMNELLDVAVLVLEEKLPRKMAPVTIYSKYKVESGIVSSLGYGFKSEDFDDESKNNYGILRIGYSQFANEIQYTAPSYIDSTKYQNDYRFVVESQNSSTAPGDSGGPLFIKGSDGGNYLIGTLRGSTINKKTVNGEYIESKVSNYTRVAYFTKWIESLMIQGSSSESLRLYGDFDDGIQFTPGTQEQLVSIKNLFNFNRKLCQRWDGWDFLPSMDECFPVTKNECERYSRTTGGNLAWNDGSKSCVAKE